MGFEHTTLCDLFGCSLYHWATGDSVVSKGQIVVIDWNRIARLRSHVRARVSNVYVPPRVYVISRKSRHCQTWLERRFSWNENLQQRQNWIAKSTKREEDAGKVEIVSEQPCELKSLDVALKIAGVEKVRSENLRLWSTLEVIQFRILNERSVTLATVEICILSGRSFLNHFDTLSETPYSCDTVHCEL